MECCVKHRGVRNMTDSHNHYALWPTWETTVHLLTVQRVQPKSVKIVLHTSKFTFQKKHFVKKLLDTAPTLCTDRLLRSYCHILSSALQSIQQCSKNTHYSAWLVKNTSTMTRNQAFRDETMSFSKYLPTFRPYVLPDHLTLKGSGTQVAKQPTRIWHPTSPESSSSPLWRPQNSNTMTITEHKSHYNIHISEIKCLTKNSNNAEECSQLTLYSRLLICTVSYKQLWV